MAAKKDKDEAKYVHAPKIDHVARKEAKVKTLHMPMKKDLNSYSDQHRVDGVFVLWTQQVFVAPARRDPPHSGYSTAGEIQK